VFSPGSEETKDERGGKLNNHLMASCVWNILAKNNQNLAIGFKFTVENVRGPSFFETQCIIELNVL